MSFGKLDSNIINSSLMNEPLHIRWVFIMFISQKDDTGFVSGTRKTMARNFNISVDDFDDAIKVLSSPDPESRTKDFDGKRIDIVDGGWILLNHGKYRAHENIKTEKRREYMKEYMRNKRKNDDSVNNVNVNKVNSELTCVNSELTSVSVSNSVSNSVSRSKNNSTNLDTSNTGKKTKEPKHKYGEYKHVLLTDKEHKKLIDDFGISEVNEMIQQLDEGIEEMGYKYKNHNLTLRRWRKNNQQKQKPENYNRFGPQKVTKEHINNILTMDLDD